MPTHNIDHDNSRLHPARSSIKVARKWMSLLTTQVLAVIHPARRLLPCRCVMTSRLDAPLLWQASNKAISIHIVSSTSMNAGLAARFIRLSADNTCCRFLPNSLWRIHSRQLLKRRVCSSPLSVAAWVCACFSLSHIACSYCTHQTAPARHVKQQTAGPVHQVWCTAVVVLVLANDRPGA